MHSVQENMAPTMAKFLAYDIPLWPMSLRTSRADGVFRGSLGSKPTLVSMPAVKTPNAPPRTNPVENKKHLRNHNTVHRSRGIQDTTLL